jgi:hypothetical protein
MTPINKITPAQAVQLLSTKEKKMDLRTFKKWAKRLGFIEYEGTTSRKILYSKEDIIKKWNQPKTEAPIKKRRGSIKA